MWRPIIALILALFLVPISSNPVAAQSVGEYFSYSYTIEFSKTETRLEVEQLLPQLVKGLQDAGIAVRKLDVVQTQIDNSGYQQLREQAAGDGGAYQQQFSQGHQDNYDLGYEWLSAEQIYAGAEFLSESPDVPSSYISDREVNILV